MFKRPAAHRRAASVVVMIEPLDSRLLFAAGPAYEHLIGLDAIRAEYPSLNGAGTTVAVIDTGVDYTLPELGGAFGGGLSGGNKVIAGYDFADDDEDPVDTDGHGTAVAGTIAGNAFTLNATTYGGIAPAAKIVALRVAQGEEGISDSNIEKALKWVIANRTKYNISVVNISIGGGAYTGPQSNTVTHDEFQTLADAGVFVTAASGNDGASASGNVGVAYPSADANVFSSGSVNATDAISTFTQRGSLLDLLAPGQSLVGLSLTAGQYATISGTSFSSPVIAGAAALVHQSVGNISPADTASILTSTGQTDYDGDNETGRTSERTYARLDVDGAIHTAMTRFLGPGRSPFEAADTIIDSALDKEGVLHVAYYDLPTTSLRYVTRNTTGTWSAVTTVDGDGTDTGISLSIAIDPAGRPGIAYYDATYGDLKYAALDGDTWQTRRVDRPKNVGQFASLAFTDAGDAQIAYYARSGQNLKIAQYVRSVDSFARSTLDSAGDVGSYASIAYNLTGNGESVLAVAYSDRTTGNLKYARYGTGGFGSAWETFTVDDTEGVSSIDLRLDTGQAQIAYQDASRGDVRFAFRANSAWNVETVASSGALGNAVSLSYGSDDSIHVDYYNRSKNTLIRADGGIGVLDQGRSVSWSTTTIAAGGRTLTSDSYNGTDLLVWRDPATNRLVSA